MKATRIRIESLAVIERFDRTEPTLVAVISSTSSNSDHSNSRCQPVDFSNYAHNALTEEKNKKINDWVEELKRQNFQVRRKWFYPFRGQCWWFLRATWPQLVTCIEYATRPNWSLIVARTRHGDLSWQSAIFFFERCLHLAFAPEIILDLYSCLDISFCRKTKCQIFN